MMVSATESGMNISATLLCVHTAVVVMKFYSPSSSMIRTAALFGSAIAVSDGGVVPVITICIMKNSGDSMLASLMI